MKYSIAAALVATCAANIAWASPITVTGGGLTAGSNTTTLPTGAVGTFIATDSRTDTEFLPNGTGVTDQVSSATASVHVSSSGLSIDTSSDGSTYIQYPSGQLLHSILGTQGSFTLDVTAAGTYDYIATSNPQSQEKITDAAGSTLLSTGCVEASLSCAGGTSFAGSLALSQGLYTLSFTDTAFQLVGNTENSTMSFSLQPSPVPLPAAAWLLLSGFAPLLSWARRRQKSV